MELLSRNGLKNGKSPKTSRKTASETEKPKNGGIVQTGRASVTTRAGSTTLEPRKAKKSMAFKTSTKKSKNKTPIKVKSTIEDKGKVQALENALSQIDKAFGSGAKISKFPVASKALALKRMEIRNIILITLLRI